MPTTFEEIIARAGLKPWPRIFRNMRASSATDWAEAQAAPIQPSELVHLSFSDGQFCLPGPHHDRLLSSADR